MTDKFIGKTFEPTIEALTLQQQLTQAQINGVLEQTTSALNEKIDSLANYTDAQDKIILDRLFIAEKELADLKTAVNQDFGQTENMFQKWKAKFPNAAAVAVSINGKLVTAASAIEAILNMPSIKSRKLVMAGTRISASKILFSDDVEVEFGALDTDLVIDGEEFKDVVFSSLSFYGVAAQYSVKFKKVLNAALPITAGRGGFAAKQISNFDWLAIETTALSLPANSFVDYVEPVPVATDDLNADGVIGLVINPQ